MEQKRKKIFEKCLENVKMADSNSVAMTSLKEAAETYIGECIKFNENLSTLIEQIICTTSVFSNVEDNKFALEFYSDMTANLVSKREKEAKICRAFQQDLMGFLAHKKYTKPEITKIVLKYI